MPVTFVAFDLLRVDGADAIGRAFAERRALLEELVVSGPGWPISETFDDREALYAAVCEHGLEGVVAKGAPAGTGRASAGGSRRRT